MSADYVLYFGERSIWAHPPFSRPHGWWAIESLGNTQKRFAGPWQTAEHGEKYLLHKNQYLPQHIYIDGLPDIEERDLPRHPERRSLARLIKDRTHRVAQYQPGYPQDTEN